MSLPPTCTYPPQHTYTPAQLSDDISVMVRTTIHAVRRRGAVPEYLSITTVNEWDPKVAGTPSDYRKLVELQRTSLLATEIKNNAPRLAKAALSAVLAGASSMRLGIVTRTTRTDPAEHTILATHTLVPTTFARDLTLSLNNAWGIVRWLVDTVRMHAKNLQLDVPDDEYSAKFVLMRDPVKKTMRLYNVSMEAFDRPEEDDGEEGAAWGADREAAPSLAAARTEDGAGAS